MEWKEENKTKKNRKGEDEKRELKREVWVKGETAA